LLAPGQMTTTTTTISPSLACTDIPTIANGYVSAATYIQNVNNVITRQIEFTCGTGYSHLNTSGSRSVSCTNGVWSTLPVCARMLS
jgi:hypothetical protein